jgi:hypothetical protein
MTDENANGLWSVEFQGILILENGRILGGDTNFTFKGRYAVKDGQFICKVKVKKYNTFLKTILPDNYIVSLHGDYEKDKLNLTGNSDINKELLINAECIKRANLT